MFGRGGGHTIASTPDQAGVTCIQVLFVNLDRWNGESPEGQYGVLTAARVREIVNHPSLLLLLSLGVYRCDSSCWLPLEFLADLRHIHEVHFIPSSSSMSFVVVFAICFGSEVSQLLVFSSFFLASGGVFTHNSDKRFRSGK